MRFGPSLLEVGCYPAFQRLSHQRDGIGWCGRPKLKTKLGPLSPAPRLSRQPVNNLSYVLLAGALTHRPPFGHALVPQSAGRVLSPIGDVGPRQDRGSLQEWPPIAPPIGLPGINNAHQTHQQTPKPPSLVPKRKRVAPPLSLSKPSPALSLW